MGESFVHAEILSSEKDAKKVRKLLSSNLMSHNLLVFTSPHLLLLFSLDQCQPNPCHNNGTCSGKDGKVICSCRDPFTGERCEKGEFFQFLTPSGAVG